MDHSVFSLFTTKDWPFPPATQDHSSPPRRINTLSTLKLLRRRQDTIDGLLFFDRLMALGSVSNSIELFPPPHPSRLRQLLDSIDACAFDLLKKNCLVYYLLKEYGDGRETRFAVDRLIPAHFTRGLDGLWALDHSEWKSAILCLSHPSVTPDFLPEIISTFATQPPIKLRAHYLLRFYRVTQPSLGLPSIELVLRAMCLQSNDRSAWSLQRSYAIPERDRLLRILFETCFGLNYYNQPLSNILQSLIKFPFDELEDSILLQFALDAPKLLPESHAMVVIHFYLSKLTAEARYIDAIRFERALSEVTQLGSNPDIDRIIRGIVEIIPQVERNMLELEFDEQHPVSNQAQDSPQGEASNDMDMSTSYDVCSRAWERPPSPPVLPPPTSLLEARTQQQQINPPKKSITRAALPLSASPILRRTMPRMSLDKSNVPQKALLQALAYSRHSSVPNSPDPKTAGSQIDQPDDQAEDSSMITSPAPTRPTARFQHFVGPSSRLPPSATKPASQPNFSTSFSRSNVSATGSPFHRLSFADPPENQQSPPVSTEERWPTRIVFTPRRPPSQSQRKLDDRPIVARQPNSRGNGQTEQVRSSMPVVSGSSSSENEDSERDAGRNKSNHSHHIRAGAGEPAREGEEFTSFGGGSAERELKSPPKKIAKVANQAFEEAAVRAAARQSERVLPGGLALDDEEMEGPAEAGREAADACRPYRASRRKKSKPDPPAAPPATPRRSSRLLSATPAKNPPVLALPGAIDERDELDLLARPTKPPPQSLLHPKPARPPKKKNTRL